MRNHLTLLLLLVCILALQPEQAHATSAASKLDRAYTKGSAASGGGTFTYSYNPGADHVAWLSAKCGMSAASSSPDHLTTAGMLFAETVVEEKNTTLTAATAYTSSNNPASSNTTVFVASHAQADDAAFVGGGPSTLVWSVSSPNAVLTLTNQGATTADVSCLIEAFVFGSQ